MSAFDASDQTAVTSDERVLRAAVAAYLGRYRGQTRLHTGSDLKIYLTWCPDQALDPLRVGRVDIERYVRWLQEIRYYQPSTVSAVYRSSSASTGSASSTRSCPTRRPTTYADHEYPPSHQPSGS